MGITRRILPLLLIGGLITPMIGGEPEYALARSIETEQDQAASVARQAGGEVLHMRWKLTGFLGALAGLFVPSSGDALMTLVPASEKNTKIELLITTPRRSGEYFLYGAEVNKRSGATAAVWSSYVFKKKQKHREQKIETANTIDVASVIYYLRQNKPKKPRRMRIWNDGKTYPVDVEPLPVEQREVLGTKRDVQGYTVRGVKLPDEEYFRDQFVLYFTSDKARTPVAILGKRGMIKLKVELVPSS